MCHGAEAQVQARIAQGMRPAAVSSKPARKHRQQLMSDGWLLGYILL
jgi:hypothetical protein